MRWQKVWLRWFIRLSFLLLCIDGSLSFLSAQDDELRWLDHVHDEQALNNLNQWWSELRTRKPLDLNRVSDAEIRALPFLSEVQATQLIVYRHRQGGVIESVYDLKSVPSWSPQLLQRLLPYIYVSESKRSTAGLLRSDVYMMGGYRSTDRGEHAPYRVRSSAQVEHVDRWRVGALYEKDSGESWLRHGKGIPQFITAYGVFERPLPMVDRLTVGDYLADLGTGLLLSSGSFRSFQLQPSGFAISDRVRPHRSAYEGYYHRGIAVEGHVKRWSWTLLGSSRPIDARIDEEHKLIEVVRRTGMHVNRRELADQSSTRMQMGAVQLRYNGVGWLLGANLLGYRWSSYKVAYFPGYYALRDQLGATSSALNGSLYGAYVSRSGRWQASGECGWDGVGRWTAYGSVAHHRLNRYSLSMDVMWGDRLFRSYYGRSLFSARAVGNEFDWRGRWQFELSDAWRSIGSLTYSRAVDVALKSLNRWRVQQAFDNQPFRSPHSVRWRLLYDHHKDAADRLGCDGRWSYRRGRGQCVVRLAWSGRRADQSEAKPFEVIEMEQGWLAEVALRMKWQWRQKSHLDWSVVGNLFATDSFGTAIYGYRPSLDYSFGFVPYYGRGGSLSSRIVWQVDRLMKVQLMVSWIKRPDFDEPNSVVVGALFKYHF